MNLIAGGEKIQRAQINYGATRMIFQKASNVFQAEFAKHHGWSLIRFAGSWELI